MTEYLKTGGTVTANYWTQSKVSRVLSPSSTLPWHDHKWVIWGPWTWLNTEKWIHSLFFKVDSVQHLQVQHLLVGLCRKAILVRIGKSQWVYSLVRGDSELEKNVLLPVEEWGIDQPFSHSSCLYRAGIEQNCPVYAQIDLRSRKVKHVI